MPGSILSATLRVVARHVTPKPFRRAALVGIPSTAMTKIEISLNRLTQLFNSFDPSPFHERDLDREAED